MSSRGESNGSGVELNGVAPSLHADGAGQAQFHDGDSTIKSTSAANALAARNGAGPSGVQFSEDVEIEMVDVSRDSASSTVSRRNRTGSKKDDADVDIGDEEDEVDEEVEGGWRNPDKPAFDRRQSAFSTKAELHAEENEQFSIDPSRPKAKLEVLSSRSISIMLAVYYGSIVVSFLILILWAILVAIKYRTEAVNLEAFVLLQVDLVGTAAIALVLMYFCIAYIIRIVFLPFNQRIVEMIWTAVMMIGLVIAFNPIILAVAAWDVINDDADPQVKTSALYVLVAAIAYEASTLFYMIAMTKLYGKWRSPAGFKEQFRFYLPIVLVVVIPLTVKLVTGIFFRFRYYYTPFGVLITLLMLAIEGIWELELYAVVIVTVSLEIALYIYVIYQANRTWKRLGHVPYAPYRYKQLGFRFFLYHTLTCWFVLIIYDILVTASTPVDRYVNSFYAWKSDIESNGGGGLSNSADVLILGQSYAFVPVYLLITVWAVEIAYVNLPADSIGCRGWCLPVRLQRKKKGDDEIHLARVYTATEKMTEETYGSKISEYFCLETCVEALNNAKLVYCNSKSAEEFNASIGGANSKIPVRHYIHIIDTDTHCFISSSDDRVYVCFRGTKSVRNIKTDLKSTTISLTKLFQIDDSLDVALPSMQTQGMEKGDKKSYIDIMDKSEDLVGIRGRRAHYGFLKAYLSVRREALAAMQKELGGGGKSIIVVGHSLGGALATLFAYDVALRQSSPLLRDSRLVVYTFGSPRVGNSVFATHFDSLVEQCWRCVNAQDIVTQIPLGRMGFRHVGTLVLMDRNGNLMVDPSVIERNWWHRQVASSGKFHLGGVYIENLKRYIETSHKNITPDFWEKAEEDGQDVAETDEHESKLSNISLKKIFRKTGFSRKKVKSGELVKEDSEAIKEQGRKEIFGKGSDDDSAEEILNRADDSD